MTMTTMIAAALTAAVGIQPPAPTPGVVGVWSNLKGTLAVRTELCGSQLCGTVVHAGPKPAADARRAGVTQLVGTSLFQNYRATGRGAWAGKLYVPDMGRTVSSHIRLSAPDRLTISGCLVGGLLCKSVEWKRIG